MVKVLVRRIVLSIPLLVAVSFLIFSLLSLAPGDPAQKAAGPEATPRHVEEVRHELKLDRPFIVRYGDWLVHAGRGDLGTSLGATQEKVTHLVLHRLTVTLSLAVYALVVGLAIGLVLGVLSALRPDGWIDRIVALWCSLAVSTPSFLFGLFLVVLFALDRTWFPATGYVPMSEGVLEWLKHLTLPAIALSGVPAAETARQLRGSLLETLDRDYILTARAKGVAPRMVLIKHAMKNAAIPPMTVLGFRIAQMLGGTVVVEQLFVLPGIGQLSVEAVIQQDYMLVLGVAVFTTVIVVIVNALVDVSYAYFNPKLRVGA